LAHATRRPLRGRERRGATFGKSGREIPDVAGKRRLLVEKPARRRSIP
jgi:hypothetical protein